MKVICYVGFRRVDHLYYFPVIADNRDCCFAGSAVLSHQTGTLVFCRSFQPVLLGSYLENEAVFYCSGVSALYHRFANGYPRRFHCPGEHVGVNPRAAH